MILNTQFFIFFILKYQHSIIFFMFDVLLEKLVSLWFVITLLVYRL